MCRVRKAGHRYCTAVNQLRERAGVLHRGAEATLRRLVLALLLPQLPRLQCRPEIIWGTRRAATKSCQWLLSVWTGVCCRVLQRQ